MRQITVAGCGIIGLTSAVALQEKGWKVRLIAKERFDNTVSHKVGAIWFPFAIQPVEKSTRWSIKTYHKYTKEQFPGNGVSFIPFTIVYDTTSDISWAQRLPAGTIRPAENKELPSGAETAYVAIVPLAEPPLYLPHLFQRFISNGGSFEKIEIKTLKQLSELDNLVINCTGLGAKFICMDEELIPMRGQILRTERLDVQSCVKSIRDGALSYIIRRNNDCIIGGTDYLNDWNMNASQNDTDLIISRFISAGLFPKPPVIFEEVVGLRPKRSEVRFTFDDQYPNIFHNYGHGGSGFTVAWGCALELAEIISGSC